MTGIVNDGVRIDVEIVALVSFGALVVVGVYRLPHDARKALLVPTEEAEGDAVSPQSCQWAASGCSTYEGTPMLGYAESRSLQGPDSSI